MEFPKRHCHLEPFFVRPEHSFSPLVKWCQEFLVRAFLVRLVQLGTPRRDVVELRTARRLPYLKI